MFQLLHLLMYDSQGHEGTMDWAHLQKVCSFRMQSKIYTLLGNQMLNDSTKVCYSM